MLRLRARVRANGIERAVANLGVHATAAPYHALGGERWLFDRGAGDLAIWDLAQITGYDDQLAERPLGAIPRCR